DGRRILAKTMRNLTANCCWLIFMSCHQNMPPPRCGLKLSAVKKQLLCQSNITPNLALVTALLKQKSSMYSSRKGPIFNMDDIKTTLPQLDDGHLHIKLAVIFMIHGGLRREEACRLTFGDVQRFDTH